MTSILILGGTAEAAALARKLDDVSDVSVITSLAGRTRHPEPLPGAMRVGGFGGADGLLRYLNEYDIDVLIDATHPFTRMIGENAVMAAERAGIPRLRLIRRPWPRLPGDHWIDVPDINNAAKALPGLVRRVFLTTGHKDLEAFAGLDYIWFLIRTIEPPDGPLPKQVELLAARGPFCEEDEFALLKRHRVDALVTKASGGEATYAKITAASRLGIPVIMIQRPPPPPGPIIHNAEDALTWLRQVTA